MVITSKEVRTIGLLNRIKNAIEQGPAKGPEIDPLAEIESPGGWKDLSEWLGYRKDGISQNKLNSATYYSCMLIRCNAIAKLPVKLMKETDQGSEKAVGNAKYSLLKYRPNPFTTPHDFMFSTEFQRLEYGNAYWFIDSGKSGEIKALYLLDSQLMSIIIDNSKIFQEKNSVYYRYNDPVQGEMIFPSDSIVHLKNFATDGIKGTSIKRYMADVIESEQHARNIIKGRYKDGLQDPILVEYTGDFDNEKKKAAIQRKFTNMGGSKNAGKVIPIPAEFKVHQLETKLVNSQFFQLQGLTTRQIANAFGVKGFQLNDMEKSTYNNIEQQNRAFYSDTLQNAITEYEQEMNYKLLSSKEQRDGHYWDFNVDVMLRSDIESRYRAYQTGITAGFLKISEARQKENLPFEDGSDRLIIGNGASIPLTDLGKQYSAKEVKNNE